MIVGPEPALAPVTLPVIAPIVQVKLLGTDDVKLIFVSVPLQIAVLLLAVTNGSGLTVTVIAYVAPTHDPVTAVGVTRYSTVPATRLLGLVNTWLMVDPEPLLAPVILPEMVPIVQVKLLGTEAVKMIFGLVPLHIVAVLAVVTAGVG